MTVEVATEIVRVATYYGDMTPLQEALLTLIQDLQARLAAKEVAA